MAAPPSVRRTLLEEEEDADALTITPFVLDIPGSLHRPKKVARPKATQQTRRRLQEARFLEVVFLDCLFEVRFEESHAFALVFVSNFLTLTACCVRRGTKVPYPSERGKV